MRQLRFAFRMLVKDPWFTGVAVIALALGISVNSTVFTFVNAVLLRGLPFDHPEEITHVNGHNRVTGDDTGISYPDFADFRTQAKAFTALAAYCGATANVSDNEHAPERLKGMWLSANSFSIILRQPTALGRDFREDEDTSAAAPVAILSDAVWKNRYGGDPGVIGRVIRVNQVPTTIIGVMPPRMRFPVDSDIWLPLVETPKLKSRDGRSLNMFGRLAPGGTLRQAQAELSAISGRLEQQYQDSNKAIDVSVKTFNEQFNGGPIRMVFLALMGAVGFVLLIACANVANLLLARSVSRSREIAVRVALGATRGQIVRQLLLESTLLSCLGGVAGLGLSAVSVRLFDAAVANVGKPYWIQFTMDGTVIAFFVGVCLATGVIFGLAPALQVSRTNLNDVLKEGGRGSAGGVRSRRLTSAMVVTELALTLVLLAGAGLMIRSFFKLYNADLGIDTKNLLTMRLTLTDQKYPDEERRRLFYDALLPRLTELPGVQAAALSTSVPMSGGQPRNLEIDGRPAPDPAHPPVVTTLLVSPSYFQALSITAREGRALRDGDGASGSEAIVVNTRFASQYFPGESAIGKHIRLAADPGSKTLPWLTIVGITPSVRQRNLQEIEPDAVAYLPYRLAPPVGVAVIVRSDATQASLIPALRSAVQQVDPDQPVFDANSMDGVLAQQRWPFRVFGSMFTIFAIIALLLSAVGIYAVTAYSVTQRTQEIGVRMALGAGRAQVSWLVLKHGLVQLGIGLVLGLAGASGVGTILAGVLVQTPARDPVTLTSIAALISAITVLACLIPAARAASLDPLVALRVD